MLAPTDLFIGLPSNLSDELSTTLFDAARVCIERNAARGDISPDEFWFDQNQHEWFLALKMVARLRFEGDDHPIEMKSGDFVAIPAYKKHSVDWTTPDEQTIWLEVHYGDQR